MALQPLIRKGIRSNATARRLIEASTIATHLIESTIYDENVNASIKRCKAVEPFVLGKVFVPSGQKFYLVASKFANRFYVVVFNANLRQYQCSSKDKSVADRCIEQVRAYRQSLKVQLQEVA